MRLEPTTVSAAEVNPLFQRKLVQADVAGPL